MCILPEYIFSNQKKKKIQKCKWSRIVKTIWEKKKVRDTSPDTKFYYIATVTNGAWYWYKETQRPMEENIRVHQMDPTHIWRYFMKKVAS